MSDTELEQYLSNLEKKLDKLLNLNTKIAKALHLLPVTEKEEKALQIQQRTNLATQAKVNEELNAMENKSNDVEEGLVFSALVSNSDIYDDIIDTDYIGK